MRLKRMPKFATTTTEAKTVPVPVDTLIEDEGKQYLYATLDYAGLGEEELGGHGLHAQRFPGISTPFVDAQKVYQHYSRLWWSEGSRFPDALARSMKFSGLLQRWRRGELRVNFIWDLSADAVVPADAA
jgi:hypothetical protein